jgi:hypothetical protein
MANQRRSNEVLVIRGTLDASGRFEARRCGSTFFVRAWPRVEASDYVMELLDRSESPLHRVFAQVTKENSCDPLDSERFRVIAYIGLREDAALVQLRAGDLVLWRKEIVAAPTIDVSLRGRGISREEPAVLRLKLSPPGDGAWLQVIYQWGERRFHTMQIRDPAPEVTVNLRQSPGGPACRFVVIYGNGLRSASAATRQYPLDPLGSTVTIWHPAARATLNVGQHLVLQGQAVDLERAGGVRNEDLTWRVDGTVVGRGLISGVDNLAPGRHRVELHYEGAHKGQSEKAAVVVNVLRSEVPHADKWQPFDYWAGIA